jgi:hypothetical protein
MTAPETVARRPTREEINAMRLKAFHSNLHDDRMAYYKACSGWFQDECCRELERADLHRAEVEAAVVRAIEAAAVKVEWEFNSMRDEQIVWAHDDIRALASDPDALERIIDGPT